MKLAIENLHHDMTIERISELLDSMMLHGNNSAEEKLYWLLSELQKAVDTCDDIRKTLAYKGYKGYYQFDSEFKIYYGEVVDIMDIITFQATYSEEMEKAFRDSVDDYLAFRLTGRLRTAEERKKTFIESGRC
jgi:hypothetical protein